MGALKNMCVLRAPNHSLRLLFIGVYAPEECCAGAQLKDTYVPEVSGEMQGHERRQTDDQAEAHYADALIGALIESAHCGRADENDADGTPMARSKVSRACRALSRACRAQLHIYAAPPPPIIFFGNFF